jgi:hypothetical protein
MKESFPFKVGQRQKGDIALKFISCSDCAKASLGYHIPLMILSATKNFIEVSGITNHWLSKS